MSEWIGRADAGIGEEQTRRALARLDRLADWLDSRFVVPGTDFRIGLDPLIGLVPGIGDAAGLLLSSWIVGESVRLGARKRTLARMAWNVLLESVVGIVPILGDLFDARWRANRRNVDLLRAELERRPGTRRPA